MALTPNVPFDAIVVGQTAQLIQPVTDADVRRFAAVSGDTNPIHLDEAYANTTPFQGRIVHGMLVGSYISTALATRLPGPGTVLLSLTLRFEHPVRIGDVVTTVLEVTQKREDRRFVTLACRVSNQDDKRVLSGEALVLAPDTRIEVELPDPGALGG